MSTKLLVPRAATWIAGILAVCWSYAAVFDGGLRAAEAPFERVELPSFHPDQVGGSVVVMKTSAAFESMMLEPLNPAPSAKGVLDRFDIVADTAAKIWRIEAVGKTDKRKTVGRLSLESGGLVFRWEPGVTRVDGGPLRNCALRCRDGSAQCVIVLRKPIEQPAWPFDLKKDLARFTIGEDLPDETQLTLTIDGVSGLADAAVLSTATGSLKESCFAVLKSPTAEMPGVRLRVVLWKSSSKPEVLIRPELTPMLNQPQPRQPAQAIVRPPVRPTGTKKTLASGDGFDPNKTATMSFTTRGLAAIKTQLQRDLQGGEGLMAQNLVAIAAGQRELEKWSDGIIGTEAEIRAILARLDRVKADLRIRNDQNRILETETLPNIKRQLWACPELDKLNASWHAQATLAFRVSYELEGRPVDLLVFGGRKSSPQP